MPSIWLILVCCSGIMVSGCMVVEPTHSIDSRVRKKLDEGNYLEALRLLPTALEEWTEDTRGAGESFEGASDYLSFRTLDTIARSGDKDWGRIFDDDEIPYETKLLVLLEIIYNRVTSDVVVDDDNHLRVPMRKVRGEQGR